MFELLTGFNPFFEDDSYEDIKNVVECNVNWPPYIDPLIKVNLMRIFLKGFLLGILLKGLLGKIF